MNLWLGKAQLHKQIKWFIGCIKRERERERESGYTGLINIASGLDLEWMEFYILYSWINAPGEQAVVFTFVFNH